MVKSIKGLIVASSTLALIFSTSTLWGGTTGKISGSVVDEASGAPLIGANVVIVGTSMGAAADVEGDYFIINIPPGTYEVAVSMIGYQAVQQTGVIVRIDHTTPVDFELSSTVLQAEAVTVTAEREIVKMDQSSSTISASYEEIQAVPILKDITDYMALQAGFSGNQIRGGGMDETEFMMDGLVVVDNRTNQPMMLVNLSSVQELNIVTGGFNAEYGNVRSGLINVVTKEGSPTRYNASVDLRYTPPYQKHRGPSVFDPENYRLRPYLDPDVAFVGTANGGWDANERRSNLSFAGWNDSSYSYHLGMTPEQAQQRFIWEHLVEGKPEWNIPSAESLGQTPRTYADIPEFNYDLSVGGPVPILNRFLDDLSFFLSHRTNRETYAGPAPTEDDDGYFQEQNTQLKFTASVTPTINLTLEGLYNEAHSYSIGGGLLRGGANIGNVYWVGTGSPAEERRSMLGLGVDHVLSPNTYYSFRLAYTTSEVEINAWDEIRYRSPDTVRWFGDVAVTELPYGYVHDRTLAFVTEGFMGGEGPHRRDNSGVNTTNIRFDLTSQINKYHEIKTGFTYVMDEITEKSMRDVYVQPAMTNPTDWAHSPFRMGAYLQDKLEFEGMIANIGIRMDYNNPNTEWYTVDRYSKYFSNRYRDVFEEEAPKERAEGKLKISPRIGISHPISEDAKLFFNYGHFYSMPGSSQMYRISYGNPSSQGVTGLGNPNADLPKTISYELGVDYDISNSILVQLKGYYKDVTNQTSGIRYINFDESVNYTTYENNNYEDVRGLEIRVDKRMGRWVTGWANYDYMVQTSGDIGRSAHYEDPYRELLEGQQDPDQERPLPRPTMRANLTLKTPGDFGPSVGGVSLIGGWNFSFLYTWRSGSYMTWDPLNTYLLENNLQWKPTENADLRISKNFRLMNSNISVFADISNVFDLRHLSGGFGGSEGSTADRNAYMNSLHLPMYKDEDYKDLDYWSETDLETDIRYPVHPKGFDEFEIEVNGDITDQIPDWWDGTAVYDAGDDRTTLTSVAREFDDKLGDRVSDDKPYINMPNVKYNWYNNAVRHITFGLRVSF